jgi:hypothetical protein
MHVDRAAVGGHRHPAVQDFYRRRARVRAHKPIRPFQPRQVVVYFDTLMAYRLFDGDLDVMGAFAPGGVVLPRSCFREGSGSSAEEDSPSASAPHG